MTIIRRCIPFSLIIICILIFINTALATNYGGPIDLESKLNRAEQQILQKISDGKEADLKESGAKSEITARFVEALLTGEFKRLNIHRHGVNIKNAKILIPLDNKLDLKLAKVNFEVIFINCDFIGEVNFEDSH